MDTIETVDFFVRQIKIPLIAREKNSLTEGEKSVRKEKRQIEASHFVNTSTLT